MTEHSGAQGDRRGAGAQEEQPTDGARVHGPCTPGPADALRSRHHLACTEGPDTGVVLPLAGSLVLGREGDVPLASGSVSRRHARVTALPAGRRRGRNAPVAVVEDLGSANGTSVRHRPSLPRSRASGHHLVPGSRLVIGTDVFEVRERPDQLRWPQPEQQRRRPLTALAPVAMVLGFLAWRLTAAGGWRLLAGVCALALLTAVVVLVVRRSRRSRVWARSDAAHLALVLASLAAAGPRPTVVGQVGGAPPGATADTVLSPRPEGPGTDLDVWTGRVGPGGAVALLLPSGGGAGHGSPSPATGSGTRGGGTEPTRHGGAAVAQRLGLVGARSLGAARWCCAQLAARTGGATVTFLLRGGVQEGRPPSGVTAPGARAHAHVGAATGPGGGLPAPARGSSASTTDVGDAADARSGGGGGGGPSVAEVCVLGDGRTPVHVVEGGECPLCRPLPPPGGEGGRPSSAPSEQRADPRTVHIGIAATYRDLPAWCDRAEEDPTPPVSPAWWAQVAHPGPPGLGAGPHPGVLPDRVLLEELAPALRDHRERSGTPAVGPSGSGGAEGTTSSTVGVPDGDGAGPGASGSRGGDPTGLPAVIGVGTWGHHVIDLVRDGPHALLAGTTGAGKSEALATWLVSLALGHPPERLRLVLIDYKGGAALGPFAALPHTEAVLTDLDPAATDRALRGLSSLLRHRERQLAEMGLPDLQRWEAAHASGRAPAPPPRVVVVVDEFRVLADSHPSTLDSLVRLSAQGRSLGLHLVAATQRPAGALTPAMRANIEIRLALRCAEEADSLDVLGSPAAARLPRVPGRALLRGVGPLQVAWVPDLTWALALVGRRWDGRGGPVASGGAHAAAVARDGLVMRDGLVTRDGSPPDPSASRPGRHPPLWPPPLPSQCSWSDLVDAQGPPPGPDPPAAAAPLAPHAPAPPPPPATPAPTAAGIPVALADRITRGGDAPLTWRRGAIGIEGAGHRAAEMETMALCLAARIAGRRAVPLHACTPADRSLRPPDCGSWIGPDEGGAVAMLLEGILAHTPAVLVVTDTVGMLDSLDHALGPGHGRALWARVLARADRQGLTIVSVARLDGGGTGTALRPPHRLVLVGNGEEALRAGLRADTPTSLDPGRVQALGFGEDPAHPLLCQVPLVMPSPVRAEVGAGTWCVRVGPEPGWELPDSSLGWAGAELSPLHMPPDLEWVVVAADPGPALVRLEACATAAGTGWTGPPAPRTGDATGTREGAEPDPGGNGEHGDGQAGTHSPGITLLRPDQWPALGSLRGRAVLALDPSPELIRLLEAGAHRPAPALRAMEWDGHSGVVAHAGSLTRIVLPR